MFRITAKFDGQERTETAETISEALTWAEEFQYLGATKISVTDEARTYQLDDLVGLVQRLRGKPGKN